MNFYPFLLVTIKNNTIRESALRAEGPDSHKSHGLSDTGIKSSYRYPSFFKSRGSLTVEAALAFPIFIFSLTALLYLFFLAQLRTEVSRALTDTSRELAWTAYYTDDAGSLAPSALAMYYGSANLSDRLDGKAAAGIVDGGISGISILGTSYDDDSCELTMEAVYSVVLPPGLGWFNPIEITQTRTVRGWSGFTGKSSYSSTTEDDLVYVTNYGTVYHCSLSCRYLDLSIDTCSLDEVSSKRNVDGGKYYPCEKCWDGTSDTVYITDSGTRYHQTLGCSSLVRGISTMLLDEALSQGYTACSACGGS